MELVQIPTNLLNERFNDRYFDVVNALDEAQQIFFRHNNLCRRLEAARAAGQPLFIGETGFGAGRLLVALLEFLRQEKLTDVAVRYYSVEMYPLTGERMEELLGGFKQRVPAEIAALLKAYRTLDRGRAGWHSLRLEPPYGAVEVELWLGEALEMVEALPTACHVWFLDGHSPKKNPSIWRPDLLKAIGAKTKEGGSCATFTVAGAVRRGLEAAGFSLRRLPGCGGKKEVLLGLK